VNLNEDPSMSECLLYLINDGVTRVGSVEANSIPQDIQLSGYNILIEHCLIQNNEGIVTMTPKKGALCRVNGKKVQQTILLNTGNWVMLGNEHTFKFIHPDQGMLEESLLQ
jgi:kinesin family protein 1